MEKNKPCTIYRGSNGDYHNARIVSNKVRGIGIKFTPEEILLAAIFDEGLGRFYTGYYKENENSFPTEEQIKDGPAKWGFFDIRTGKIIVPPVYEHFDCFYDNRARVKLYGKYGFVDLVGEIVVPPIYEYADCFYEDRVRVKLDGKYGFVDLAGKIVVPPMYEYVGRFYDDRALVKLGGKYGFVDHNGSVAVDIEWDQARDFSEERCAVGKGDKWGYVNNDGMIIPGLTCDAICTIYDCEYNMFSERIIVSNTLYGISYEGNRVPAEYVECKHVGQSIGQFFTGYYKHSGLDATEEQLINEPARWYRIASINSAI
jgi:hypothetical protein